MKLVIANFLLSSIAATFVLMLVNGDPIDNNKQKDNLESKNVPHIFDYGRYVEQFKKAYSPVETMNKAKLFFGRTLKMFQHNVMFQDEKVDYYLGQNQFTDMTASELKELRAKSSDSDFAPVLEAKQNPDLPASSSVVVAKLSQHGEGESHASFNDIERSSKLVPKRKAIVDFMEDDDKGIEDFSGVLKQLEKKPKLAKQVADVVDSTKQQQELKIKHEKELEKAAKKNKILSKPVPKSNNKDYDYDSIASYGATADVFENFAENYAKYLMNDPNDFGYNLTPYKTPANAKSISLDEEDEQEAIDQVNEVSSPLAGLFGSMKSIYDYFTLEGYDESQDQDVAPAHVEKPKPTGRDGDSVINYDIDWRKTGCIAGPKNQKDCNSCYAFTTLSLMEYFHCMQTKQLTEFSPQYIVDCGPKNDLHGCQGGKISGVGQFIRNYGIELAATYPYTAREGQCSIVDDSNAKKAGYLRPQITAWQNFPSIGAWYKWLPKSPVIVGISMPTDFFGYAGGIHDGSTCDENFIHAMLLVGSGKQDDKEFWLLKNSYSPDWGEAGYFRLSKAAPMRCFNSAVVARPKFA